jgi:hypothetical protein
VVAGLLGAVLAGADEAIAGAEAALLGEVSAERVTVGVCDAAVVTAA